MSKMSKDVWLDGLSRFLCSMVALLRGREGEKAAGTRLAGNKEKEEAAAATAALTAAAAIAAAAQLYRFTLAA